jgi:hypothetical protein
MGTREKMNDFDRKYSSMSVSERKRAYNDMQRDFAGIGAGIIGDAARGIGNFFRERREAKERAEEERRLEQERREREEREARRRKAVKRTAIIIIIAGVGAGGFLLANKLFLHKTGAVSGNVETAANATETGTETEAHDTGAVETASDEPDPAVKNGFMHKAGEFFTGTGRAIKAFFVGVWNAIKPFFVKVWIFVTVNFGRFIDFIKGIWGKIRL